MYLCFHSSTGKLFLLSEQVVQILSFIEERCPSLHIRHEVFPPAKREMPGLPNNSLPIENSQLQKSLDFWFGAITLLIISSKLGSDNLACSDQKIEDLICLS